MTDLHRKDALARIRALDPGQSFIVQAPAGSGKTELLTQRYLRLLSVVDHPEEVIAITFTRKAAGEMLGRVLGALELAATTGEPPAEEHRRLTWELARDALARDTDRGWQLRLNPRRLRIQTIDSLCLSLARQMPVLSRLGSEHEIATDPDLLYREAARLVMEQLEADDQPAWSSAVATLLLHLDNDVARVESLLAVMLRQRDQWSRHIGRPDRQPQPRAELEEALARAIREMLARVRGLVPGEAAAALAGVAGRAGQALRTDGSESPIVHCADLDGLPAEDEEGRDAWIGLRTLLLTKDGKKFRAKLDAKVGVPAQGDREFFDHANAVLAMLHDNADLRAAFAALDWLPAPRYSEEQWATIEALHQLLPLAVAALRLSFGEAGALDYTEIAQAAARGLGAPGEPTDLALALDYRMSHLLVDEFQDISISQSELLHRLTAGWVRGDGRTLFAVGDPMQSIYRFREAEVGLFLRARTIPINDIALKALELAVNFRSGERVVEWVNDAFARVFPASEDSANGAVVYAPCVARPGAPEGGGVHVHCLVDEEKDNEHELVVRLVRESLVAFPDGTTAILVRARSHLAQIVPALRRAALPFRALEIEELSRRQVVQDLHALTRALLHPADRLAWLAVLRAPWCGLSLSDLKACADAATHGFWPVIAAGEAPGLCEDGRRRLQRLRAALESVIETRRRRGLRRWIEGAWYALGGPACVAEPTDLEDASVYLDLLDGAERAGDIEHFGRLGEQVGQLYARPDVRGSDALQVMTVHKAKGLQFHSVIVPGLHRRPPASAPGLLTWLERAGAGTEGDLLLAPVPATGGGDDSISKFVQEVEKTRARNEDARLLYVAATRAIDRLHLIGAARSETDGKGIRSPASSSLLACLWPAVAHRFEQAARATGPKERSGAPDPDATGAGTIWRLPLGIELPEPPAAVRWEGAGKELPGSEAAVEFSWAGQTAMIAGTVVHEILLRIARDGIDAWTAERVAALQPYLRARLGQLGVSLPEVDETVARVNEAIRASMSSPRGRWLLGGQAAARSEFPLAGVLDGHIVHVVLDRTFIDGQGVRWIVDYKTGSHEGGDLEAFLDREQERYQSQLERYARLVSALDARPIRLGLYYPLVDGWREWDFHGA